VRSHDLSLRQLSGRFERLGGEGDPLVGLQLAQDHRHVVVDDLDPPRVDGAIHGVIVPDHFAGTSFFAVQKTAFVSIRMKLSSLKSSGWPSDV
jgi:hypothetical protein